MVGLKEIVVEECGPETFKALLKFIYTDDLQRIEEVAKLSKEQSCIGNKLPAPFLQKLLSVSHLYQVNRLRIWCEHKLCECLTVMDAFSILCQAHLYEAKQLEQASLAFIKDNLAQVVSSSSFGRGCKDWPEVVLKINAATAGLDERSAGMAFEALREKPKEEPKEDKENGKEDEAASKEKAPKETEKSEKAPKEKAEKEKPAEKPAKRKRTSWRLRELQ